MKTNAVAVLSTQVAIISVGTALCTRIKLLNNLDDRIKTLTVRLTEAQRYVDRQAGEARMVAMATNTLKTQVAELTVVGEACEEAIRVLQSFGETRQQELQTKIETLVTHGLRSIFDADMTFHISQKKVGQQVAMDFTITSLVNGELVETSIMDARGGGVAATAGFLLRLLFLLLKKDSARPTLVLDESFAQLSTGYAERLALFLRELVDKTGVQIILVTHSTVFSETADTTYEFSLVDGVTQVKGV